MLFDAFSQVSRASGLAANIDKSNIYIGGVIATEREAIVASVHISKGQFPFQIFGSTSDYQETWHTDPSKKSLVTWHSLCLPRSASGWNLKEMSLWNKADVSNLLWALTHKKDKLWCRWVHAYYIKGRSLSTQWPSTISCSLRKILSSYQLIHDVGGWENVCRKSKFSIKLMYQALLGNHEKVTWRRILCNNSATPKSFFITWLTLWNRLPTKDRLLTWKVVTDDQCPLCSKCSESVSHLFFECDYATSIWQKVLHSL
ncbi:uncharacterized protein [Spinacia oleracea]|uniref:Reverse transcriptase zinc-binding domain-containing protein n=1 Tax=Spinacia oleracea TaxID=3562 RepID=A0A9R0K3K1_SPIOL|nr:uncharacterized protein LOC110796448 [Spinacia oleracea]